MATDYSKIAKKYDKNPLRGKTVDFEIKQILEHNNNPITVLDLACGTGNYLKVQSDFYKDENITWAGMDKSEEMLKFAKEKNSDIQFIHGSIDISGSMEKKFDYIRNEFAFHHFENKEAAVKNIKKMLKQNGTYIMINICPDYIHHSWVYSFFPSSREIDSKRFISVPEIHKLFTNNGFDINIKIETTVTQLNYEAVIQEAKNRDMSQLTLISEKEYQAGLKKMKSDFKYNVQKVHDFSLITCRAMKK